MATDGYVDRWNGVAYAAVDERRMASVDQMPGPASAPFSARGGRRVNGAGLAVTVNSTGNGSVTVSPGACRIYSSTYASQGAWDTEFPNTIGPLTLGARPAAGQSRIDLVIARIYDQDISLGSVREAKIEIVAGNANAAPVPPSPSGLFLVLNTLTVPSSGTISATQSTAVAVSAGGILPVATTAERDALVTVGIAYPGLTVFNAQTQSQETYPGSGTTWLTIAWATKHIADAINTTTNATGYVTFNHGGPSAPKSVQLSGRNAGHYPYLTALDATTVTVRFLLRSSGAALTAATPVSFDWSCDFT